MHVPSPGAIRFWFSVLLVVAGAGPGGCRSVYHRAMEEYSPPSRSLLAQRVTEARDAQRSARDELIAGMDAVRRAAERPADEEAAQRAAGVQLDRAEWWLWDAGRRMSSIDDVVNGLPEDGGTGSRRLVRERTAALMKTMNAAQQDMTALLVALRDELAQRQSTGDASRVHALTDRLNQVWAEAEALILWLDAPADRLTSAA